MDKDTKNLLRVLDAVDHSPGAAELRSLTYALLRGPVNGAVLDAGCGAGRAVAELTALGVAAEGADLDEGMIETARDRLPGGTFRVADACDLPYGDASLAGYRADKLLHTLPDPARALAEARRVLKPGGRAVLAGQDWETAVIDSDDAALTQTIVWARAALIASPRAARAHRNLLLDAGFHEVRVEVRTAVFTGLELLPMATGLAEAAAAAGGVPAREAAAWIAEQRDRAARDRFFMAVPFFLASATVPRD
ncbi:methyltransferase domain-containing protein [Streptomyces sp. NPDC005566]|uniref:methyltransferase domain-containing protein n=1 Tax=Streptomyces sp. NPDC005566 TaxID=3156886 RepID=UPI0033A473AC